jgi:hypothetical protein
LTARHSYQEAKAKTSIVEKTDGVFDDNGESGRSMDGWMEAAHISRLGIALKRKSLFLLLSGHIRRRRRPLHGEEEEEGKR